MTREYPNANTYMQAKQYAKGRPDGPPLWLVFHTMEVSESLTAAEGTARYFQTLSDGRTVSSHTCIDADSAVQCVSVYDVAYCGGNRPGNRRGIHIEQAGTARQTSTQWQDAYSQALIKRVAKVHAIDCVRFGIPIRWLTVDQVKAGHKGFCTHNDLRLAFNVTTHWDPGPNYPKGQVADLFRAEVAKLIPPSPPVTELPLDTTKRLIMGLQVLRRGSTGRQVKTAQTLLNGFGWNAGTVDGDFGPATEAAVKRMQTYAKRPATGVVGSAEWQLLLAGDYFLDEQAARLQS